MHWALVGRCLGLQSTTSLDIGFMLEESLDVLPVGNQSMPAALWARVLDFMSCRTVEHLSGKHS